jgi:hydrogenase maturation protease
MGDDGVGVEAAIRLSAITKTFPDVSCLDGGTLGYLLMSYIEEVNNLIVIDAAQMCLQPGEIRLFQSEDMDNFLSTNPYRSIHEVGLSDLLSMAWLGGYLPSRRALIGIQPFNVGTGFELSEPVSKSLPLVCDTALELIQSWRH